MTVLVGIIGGGVFEFGPEHDDERVRSRSERQKTHGTGNHQTGSQRWACRSYRVERRQCASRIQRTGLV